MFTSLHERTYDVSNTKSKKLIRVCTICSYLYLKSRGPFVSLFLMRKRLSIGQNWFLRPFFPLIRDNVYIQKWYLIFVSGTGSGRTESEQKATLVSENGLFLTLDVLI